MSNSLGYTWISEQTGIVPVQPFTVVSRIGTMRKSFQFNTLGEEIYPASFRPAPTIAAHLAFALKYETVHLEFLSRLFHAIEPTILETWIRTEPTGSYARRIGFFYEWLTGKHLDVPNAGGNYIPALPEARYLTAPQAINNRRWRVRDNLPGTPDFCPLIQRTSRIRSVETYDATRAIETLEREYGADLLMRSAVWLTIRESRASFAIEHEEKQVDRIKRFAAAMAEHCGKSSTPLASLELLELQSAILGRATRHGLRQSPVFVGHVRGYSEVVDYVGPHWEQIGALLQGLQAFLERTASRPAILRAAVTSFGFVYIHPLHDGNGRISRFLVNDVLRRDGVVPAPFILPISATITNTNRARAGYDQTLEALSRPMMAVYAKHCRFARATMHEDGIRSNFLFDAYDDALHVWKYPDFTAHAEYLGEVVRVTIEEEMDNEAKYLRSLSRAREGVKNWLEGPNTDIDRIIRSVSQGREWRVSNVLSKEFPALADTAIAQQVVDAVRKAFSESRNDRKNVSAKMLAAPAVNEAEPEHRADRQRWQTQQ